MAAIAHVSAPGISYSDLRKPTGLMQMHAAYTCALYNRLRFSGGLVAVDGHELKSLGTMCF